MKGAEATEIVGDLASQQWGLVTSAQAKGYGVDALSLRRLAEHGALIRMRHGVYATTSTTPSNNLETQAQWLALRPDVMAADRIRNIEPDSEAIVSHTTAAELWEIGDLWPDGIHFTVKNRRRSRQEEIQFHRADITKSEWTIHPTVGLPTTTPLQTIIDLAKEDHEPDHLLTLISDGARKSLFTKQELINSYTKNEEGLRTLASSQEELERVVGKYFSEYEIIPKITEVLLKTIKAIQPALRNLEGLQNETIKSIQPLLHQISDSQKETIKKIADLPIPDVQKLSPEEMRAIIKNISSITEQCNLIPPKDNAHEENARTDHRSPEEGGEKQEKETQ